MTVRRFQADGDASKLFRGNMLSIAWWRFKSAGFSPVGQMSRLHFLRRIEADRRLKGFFRLCPAVANCLIFRTWRFDQISYESGL